MKYRLKEGIALFSMCGSYIVFPSHSSKVPLSFIVSVSSDLVPVLKGEMSDNNLKQEEKDRLNRMLRVGLIEYEE